MEKLTLKLFWSCMLLCATFAVVGIWFQDAPLPEAWFKTMASLFIIGTASFLLWAPLVVYRFLEK